MQIFFLVMTNIKFLVVDTRLTTSILTWFVDGKEFYDINKHALSMTFKTIATYLKESKRTRINWFQVLYTQISEGNHYMKNKVKL